MEKFILNKQIGPVEGIRWIRCSMYEEALSAKTDCKVHFW